MEVFLHLLNWGLYRAIAWMAVHAARRWRARRGGRR